MAVYKLYLFIEQLTVEKPEVIDVNVLYNEKIIGKYSGTLSVLNGLPHGKGKLTIDNCYTYEGEFKNGKKSGYGSLIHNETLKYKGVFKNDRFIKGEVLQICEEMPDNAYL